eukprot:352193-Chlamydomonas_euryale.AAC.1
MPHAVMTHVLNDAHDSAAVRWSIVEQRSSAMLITNIPISTCTYGVEGLAEKEQWVGVLLKMTLPSKPLVSCAGAMCTVVGTNGSANAAAGYVLTWAGCSPTTCCSARWYSCNTLINGRASWGASHTHLGPSWANLGDIGRNIGRV